MADKGLNLFDECTAEFVYLCPKKSASSSWGDTKMYTPGTIANSQRMQTKINKNCAIAKVRLLVEQKILEGI